MSCLLWGKHYTLDISAFIISPNHDDSPGGAVKYNRPYVTKEGNEAQSG